MLPVLVARRLALVVLLGLFPSTRQAFALDFQLHGYSVSEDGFTYQRTYMQNDAATRVLITPPTGWSNSGDAVALTMVPPTPTGSMARIEKSPFSPDLTFRDKGLETYRQRTVASAPQGATAVRVVSERANAFPFFRWTAYEFVVEYQFFGQEFQRSLMFVNMNPKEQIVLSVVAPKDSFKGIDDTALDVLRSWQVVPNS